MITDIAKYTGLFGLAVFAQVLIFDNIYLSGYANIFFYVIFILLMPVEINKYFLMLLGFFIGILVDIFNNTVGMHAFATVLISFLRPFILRIYAPRDGYVPGERPGISNYGYMWFLKYTLTILLIHHLAFYYIEIFRLSNLFIILGKSVLSASLGFGVIMLSQLLFVKVKK